MSESPVLLKELDEDGVLLATLNRPKIKNAFNEEQWDALCDCFQEAGEDPNAPRAELEQLRLYAEGMQAFLVGDYTTSLATLETWADLGADDQERDFARMAASVLGRLGRLVEEGEEGAALVDRAKQLQLRLDSTSV